MANILAAVIPSSDVASVYRTAIGATRQGIAAGSNWKLPADASWYAPHTGQTSQLVAPATSTELRSSIYSPSCRHPVNDTVEATSISRSRGALSWFPVTYVHILEPSSRLNHSGEGFVSCKAGDEEHVVLSSQFPSLKRFECGNFVGEHESLSSVRFYLGFHTFPSCNSMIHIPVYEPGEEFEDESPQSPEDNSRGVKIDDHFGLVESAIEYSQKSTHNGSIPHEQDRVSFSTVTKGFSRCIQDISKSDSRHSGIGEALRSPPAKDRASPLSFPGYPEIVSTSLSIHSPTAPYTPALSWRPFSQQRIPEEPFSWPL